MMFETILSLVCVLLIVTPGHAQTFAPGPIPPLQYAKADSALSGNEFNAWLWTGAENHALVAAKLTRCRLAGVDSISPSGALTSLLSAAATNTLDDQVKEKLLLIKPLSWEPYFEWDQAAKPQPRWTQNARLVVMTWLVEWDANEKPFPTKDVAIEQLTRGWAYLNRTSSIELSQIDWPPYEAAQLEAQTKSRGIWLFGLQAWSPTPIERKDTKRPTMPARK